MEVTFLGQTILFIVSVNALSECLNDFKLQQIESYFKEKQLKFLEIQFSVKQTVM